jgi:PTS system galactosamine-specific IIB component
MHHQEGKREYKEPHVYVDDQDLADFEEMKSHGVEVYIQILPNNRKIEL